MRICVIQKAIYMIHEAIYLIQEAKYIHHQAIYLNHEAKFLPMMLIHGVIYFIHEDICREKQINFPWGHVSVPPNQLG
jgi:capsule polysaccharide modification protein KpsS